MITMIVNSLLTWGVPLVWHLLDWETGIYLDQETGIYSSSLGLADSISEREKIMKCFETASIRGDVLLKAGVLHTSPWHSRRIPEL